MSIANRLKIIHNQINERAIHCGRNPQDITIMPVTKTIDSTRIIEAIDAGYTLIGENKVQEILDKSEALNSINHQIHLIGHLQSNKIKFITDQVTCIQSIDTASLASKLQNRLSNDGKTMVIYIQVNTSREASKFGVLPENLPALLKEIVMMENLSIQGLMTIGAHTQDQSAIRQSFKDLKNLQAQCQQSFSDRASFEVLSMGMSHDYLIAIEEGATLLRIGSAIFGERNYG